MEAKPEAPAFLIAGVKFPIPTRYRMGDPVLVEEVAGLKFDEFARRLDTGEWLTGQDPAVLAGVVAVAVWQTNTDWTREKVRRMVQQVDPEQFEWSFPEQEEEAEVDPEAPGAESPSTESSDASTTTPDDSETTEHQD